MLLKEEMKRALLEASAKLGWEICSDQLNVEHPPQLSLGDVASALPLMLARTMKCPPRSIGEKLAEAFASDSFTNIYATPNGYINAFIHSSLLITNLKNLICDPYKAYAGNKGKGKRVLVEFVSANPTGPLTVANARGGPIGDTISNLLEWNGYETCKEFYVNNKGAKTEKLAYSVKYYYEKLFGRDPQMPEEFYPGSYVSSLAELLKEKYNDQLLHEEEQSLLDQIKEFCLENMLEQAKSDLAKMNISFDSWFYESTLHPDYLEKTLKHLSALGCTYQAEGALWLKTSSFGDDKDRVLVRSNSLPTYLAGDIAYHAHKFERGFDILLDVWGADQSHQKPLMWALEALGHDISRWKTVNFQLVHLFRGNEEVKMSKSSGDYITLRDLTHEVGPDVTRFLFLTRSNEQHLNFDMDLAKTRDLKNPVFYAQYAYTRCKGIMREAEKKGMTITEDCVELIREELFSHESEWMMLRKMALLHDILDKAANDFSPHVIAQSILNLSADFHQFYENCRILGIEDAKVAQNRLSIVIALEKLLKTLFRILGISSPERM